MERIKFHDRIQWIKKGEKGRICTKCQNEDWAMYLTDAGLICFDCRYPDEETEVERNERLDKEIDKEIDKEWKQHLKTKKE